MDEIAEGVGVAATTCVDREKVDLVLLRAAFLGVGVGSTDSSLVKIPILTPRQFCCGT
jgi:hypothetical protein